MGLPKAVQKAVEEADALVAQIGGDKTEEQQESYNEAPPDSETELNNEAPPDPEPTAEAPEQTVSQETQVVQKPTVSEETWERKYLTLKGMYDAEVPRLHADMREMKAQMQQLVAEKATAEAKLASQPDEPQSSLITEQDKEAFGPDLIDLINRAVKTETKSFEKRESQLLKEIEELKGQLGNVSERQVVSDKDRFLVGLSQQVPDWEALNVDQGFLSWLNEADPVYGLPRQAALNSAYEAFDVGRVAAIFKAYKQLVTPQTKQPTKPNPELQRQVAPTRSRSSTPTATDMQNQKIWTSGEIEQFYNDWRRGYIDNEEAVRMEKEINAAVTQGRIR
jgi:hypothetical protein